MSGYPPIPGSPDVVEGVAAALRDEARRIDSAQSDLRALRAGARWSSPAGLAFVDRVAELPPVLDAVADRYAAAATTLRTFAAEFREAQEACSRAIVLRERGMLRRDRYGEEAALAEASGSPAVLARVSRLRELMVEGAAEVLAQERAYREARERFEQADRRCARALGALLDDVLADTWQYDTVKGAGALGHGVADTAGLVGLVPFCKTVSGAVGATAAGVALGADLTVKLAYGEGEWRPLVGDAVLRAVGFGAGSLRQASRARGLPSAAHEGPTGFGTGQERLAAGIRAHAKESNPWRLRGPSPGPGADGPAHPQVAGSSTLRGRAREAAARRVASARDDWFLAVRNGADARAMLFTAWGLEAGRTAYTKAGQVTDAVEKGRLAYERLRGPRTCPDPPPGEHRRPPGEHNRPPGEHRRPPVSTADPPASTAEAPTSTAGTPARARPTPPASKTGAPAR